METLLQDIRYALRSLRKSPGVTLVAVLTIGLAVGVNTTAFTWMERFVLQPLPGVPESGRLVSISTGGPGGELMSVSYPDFRDWRSGSRSFEGVAAEAWLQLTLRAGDGPAQRAWGVAAPGDYFSVLGAHPALGRGLGPEDESGAAPVVVLSHSLWQRVFAGDTAVLGRHLMLNGQDFTVVGVAPRRFVGSNVGLAFDVWVPITLVELLSPNPGILTSRGSRFMMSTVARLKSGVSLEQARQDLNAIQRRLSETYPNDDGNTTVAVRWLRDSGASSWFRPVLVALLGATVVVLLVACANLANVLLAKAAARRREIGIRLAVGAGRGRLVRQLLTESLVLASGGGAVGVLLAVWGKDAMKAIVPATPYPLSMDSTLDARVLAVAALVTLATGVAFGLVPAVQSSGVALATALREGAASRPAGRARLQSALVAAQVALSLVCLVCAGLFMRGLRRAESVDTGMRDPRHVLLVNTDLFPAGFTDSTGPAAIERLLERVRGLPGVSAASLSTMVPMGFGGWSGTGVSIEGYTFRPDESNSIPYSQVGPGYFETIGTPIVRGREFSAADRAGSLPAAVINEAFARRYWPGQDPVGKHVVVAEQVQTVVGVVRDIKYRRLQDPPSPLLFHPIAQWHNSGFTLYVRSAGDPRSLQAALRSAFESVSPDLPFTDVRTLAEHMGAATFIQRNGAYSLATVGVVALILAAVGLFGVLSYSVTQRTREIGVRIAVGASRRDVVGLVVGRALRLTAIGLGVGIALAAGAGRLLRSQIFGVSPLDPVTYAGMAALLAAVALLAAWLPARRAARVDPIVALQAE